MVIDHLNPHNDSGVRKLEESKGHVYRWWHRRPGVLDVGEPRREFSSVGPSNAMALSTPLMEGTSNLHGILSLISVT